MTEHSNADKRRLDREDCLSDSIVSVGKRSGIGSAVLALPCRNYATPIKIARIKKTAYVTLNIRNTW